MKVTSNTGLFLYKLVNHVFWLTTFKIKCQVYVLCYCLFITTQLQVARMIGEDLVKKVLELFADELNLFAKDYLSKLFFQQLYFLNVHCIIFIE